MMPLAPGSRLPLMPRAAFADVLRGIAPLVGARLRTDLARGLFSPAEARAVLGLGYEDLAGLELRYLARRRSFLSDLGVIVRALIAHVLCFGSVGVIDPRPFIVSAAVDNVSIDDALERVFAPPPPSRARIVHFAHAHALTLARCDASLAGAFAAADTVLPDGIGIRIAGAVLGKRMLDNVNGTDLLPHLCERALVHAIPLVLVGGASGVAEACAANLRRAHPGLAIPIVTHGYLDHDDVQSLRNAIGTLGRCVVLVGMGSPLQERWTRAHLADLGGITALTVGGLFDFYSGRIKRAPSALREMGLEWAWRLLQEPSRLAKRYLLGNPRFLMLAMLDRLLGGRPRPLPTHALKGMPLEGEESDVALHSGVRMAAAPRVDDERSAA